MHYTFIYIYGLLNFLAICIRTIEPNRTGIQQHIAEGTQKGGILYVNNFFLFDWLIEIFCYMCRRQSFFPLSPASPISAPYMSRRYIQALFSFSGWYLIHKLLLECYLLSRGGGDMKKIIIKRVKTITTTATPSSSSPSPS